MTRQEYEDKFLKLMHELYGDKYDFSKMKGMYKNTFTKITVGCPVHGYVQMLPRTLKAGNGCHLCTRERINNAFLNAEHYRSKNDIWKKECEEKHNGKYDYSQVDLDNRREDGKVPIICHEKSDDGTEHGIFWQPPNQHKHGKGCPKCRQKKQSTVISEFKRIHGDKYDYSLVEYHKMHEKVLVKCNTCGELFEISPANHKLGRGCPMCAIENRRNKFQLPLDVVKERINKVFGEKYDLSQINYVNEDKQIKLICPVHGEFWQTPFMLFKGHGCQTCGQSALENEIQVFLDKNGIESVYEKRFDWLGRQTLDFYLPKYNVAIECQGLQHFKPVNFGDNSKEITEEKFIRTTKYDETKRKLCEENGVKLLYYSNLGIEYPYEVFEDKEKLLNKIKSVLNESNFK